MPADHRCDAMPSGGQKMTFLHIARYQPVNEAMIELYWNESRMPPSTRSMLLAMIGSVGAFLAAVAWGVEFVFPAPDAGPEESATLQLHESISGALMRLCTLVFAASFVLLVWRWLRGRARSSASSRPE